MQKYKELTILVAEDDDGHAELIMSGLKESGICNQMIRFVDGQQTWDFISGKGKNMVMDKNKSYLLLLDINMPEVSGLDVLEFVRRRKEWDSLPVVILSTEAADVTVDNAMQLGADGYVTKPVMIDELQNEISRAIRKRK